MHLGTGGWTLKQGGESSWMGSVTEIGLLWHGLSNPKCQFCKLLLSTMLPFGLTQNGFLKNVGISNNKSFDILLTAKRKVVDVR